MTPDERDAVSPELRAQIDEDAERHADAAPPIGPQALERLRELLRPVKGHDSTRKTSTDSISGASG